MCTGYSFLHRSQSSGGVPMTHGSLFSGIGGFDLAAAWAGWTNVFNCEIDPFCRRVLKYHFPESEPYEDIRTTDFTVWRDRVDVLTGGFPCQPFSLAGKRKGTADDRYLWPAMLGVVRTVRPRWVVGENVLGIVKMYVLRKSCPTRSARSWPWRRDIKIFSTTPTVSIRMLGKMMINHLVGRTRCLLRPS